MSAQSDQNKYIEKLRAKGATILDNGGPHLKIIHDGVLIGILPRKAAVGGATVRAARNVTSQARRAGLDV